MKLTLLGRPACHLCDDAAAVIVALAERYDLEVVGVDIDGNDDLVAEYGLRIPVILGPGGTVLAEGVITLEELEAALADESRTRIESPGSPG